MKRAILIAVLIVLMLPFLLGQTVHYTNQATILWDPVTPLGGDTIEYEVFWDDGSGEVSLGLTNLTEYSITFTVEGTYKVGVRTVRTIVDTGDVYYSDINWSDVNGEWTPDPFVIRFHVPPDAPRGLRNQ
jgi:hypothetical protein